MYSSSQVTNQLTTQLMATLRGFVKFYEIDQYLGEVGPLMEWPPFRVFMFNQHQYKSQI